MHFYYKEREEKKMAGTITKKRPMVKQTVGDMYYAFNTAKETGEFNPGVYEGTVECGNVKNIGTTENAENTVIRASGQDYETVNQESSIDMAVETVAFDPGDLARMKGEDTSDKGGLVLGGAPNKRPFFAYGKVVKKVGGGVRYEWFPKCQLVENTDDIATSEESFSEQNDTVTIRAYSFDDKDNKKAYVDSEMASYPEGLTEEKFFTKPILTAEDLVKAVAPGT
jgi:phi13 family phage major tail protein